MPFQKVTQTLQQTWNQTQPVLKVQSIKALRGTIQLLEGVVEKLEAEPTEQSKSPVINLPPTPNDISTETLIAEALPLDTAIAPSTPQEVSTVTPVNALEPEEPVPTKKAPKPSLVDRFLPSFDRFQTWWNVALQKIRALLPESLSQKLSDWTLTGVIALIVVILLWLSVALLPGKPTKVANVPIVDINTPPELKAPKKPETVEIAPSPNPVLTYEQNLIASIQKQIAEITNKYADGLVQSLEANFQGSLLIVKVSNYWYDFNPSKQDNLADEMLRRAQELDFSKLKITDLSGTLLARSPVVGSHMVIVKRQLSA
ncbi:MAG: hypothetical protein NVS2B14_11280 [Chamaesiphon sp.]